MAIPDEKYNMNELKEKNIIANDFFEFAEPIRKDIGIDYLVGITPSMVAGYNKDKHMFWNYFATFSDKTIMVSTYGLREFAKSTKRKYEAFLAGIVIAQFLVAKFNPKLHFHENCGCLFDFNEDRTSIMDKAYKLDICQNCYDAISESYHPSVMALLDFLRNYGRE